jgi:hypothetical protein
MTDALEPTRSLPFHKVAYAVIVEASYPDYGEDNQWTSVYTPETLYFATPEARSHAYATTLFRLESHPSRTLDNSYPFSDPVLIRDDLPYATADDLYAAIVEALNVVTGTAEAA